MRARARAAGFTLAEVMIALAILALALTMLVRSIAGNISAAQDSMYMGLAGDLGRSKLYDVEEHVAQEGFKDTEEHEEGKFDDEGWPAIEWEYRVIPVELPTLEKLLGLGQGSGSGSGSGSGADADGDGQPDPEQLGRLQNSALGQALSMFGGGLGSTDAAGGMDLSRMSLVYPLISDTLKKSIRKVVLTVRWDTGFEKDHVDFVTFLTDINAMCKALPYPGGGCK